MKSHTDILTYERLAIVADAVRRLNPEINAGHIWIPATGDPKRGFFHRDWQFGDDGNAYWHLQDTP